MARSYKKNPSYQNPAMGEWKRDTNRAFRRITHNTLQLIENGDEDAIDDLPEDVKEVSDIWVSPNDGNPGYISETEIQRGDWLKVHKLKGK